MFVGIGLTGKRKVEEVMCWFLYRDNLLLLDNEMKENHNFL